MVPGSEGEVRQEFPFAPERLEFVVAIDVVELPRKAVAIVRPQAESL